MFANFTAGPCGIDLADIVESLVLVIGAKSGNGAGRAMGPPLTRPRQDVQDRTGA